MEELIGDYVVEAKAVYVPDKSKWQAVLRIWRSRHSPEASIYQDFTQLPVLSRSEMDAILYGLARGRGLIEGSVIGLTI